MPINIAEHYCLDIVHGIAGLFDVEPCARPVWLSDFPERFCSSEADFMLLVRELLQASQTEGMSVISLDTPIASSVQKYAKLSLSAHFVTPDYELPDGAVLNEKLSPLWIADTFELKGPPANISIQEASRDGKVGNEAAVCGVLFPIPHGTWHGD